MTIFAHTYRNAEEAEDNDVIDYEAAFTLIFHGADGTVMTVNSNELPAIASENNAISCAMFAVHDHDDDCDVLHYGEYHGTAEYVNTTPNSFFESVQVVFSMPC